MKKRWFFCPAMQENPISTASSCGLTKKGMGFLSCKAGECFASSLSLVSYFDCVFLRIDKKGVERIHEMGNKSYEKKMSFLSCFARESYFDCVFLRIDKRRGWAD
jgi:hypothetical protein